MTNYREVQRSTLLPDQIAADIMAKITEGTLQPGDTLPTEHALAGTFGVSRNVVREAIARLRSDGVVESRQGRGAVVKPITERETFRVDIQALGKSGNLADLFELRGLLEIEAAGLAAVRRTSVDLEEMCKAIAELDGGSRFDDRRLEADAAFHRAIGKATANAYLYGIICYISSRLKDTARITSNIYEKDDLVQVTRAEHLKILKAIEVGDRLEARRAMSAHISAASKRLNVPVKPTGHL